MNPSTRDIMVMELTAANDFNKFMIDRLKEYNRISLTASAATDYD
ncbi:hypothetical protein BML2531_24660 [Providencia rettgeri]|nr:hypothetical protein BML2531_24660 [Providencia rettgeri]